MLSYLYYQTYTSEIPNELSLGISILGCPIHCPDCHSRHVWDIYDRGQGEALTKEELDRIIFKQQGVSCILFYGGEWDLDYLTALLCHLKFDLRHDYKLALYSGRNFDFFAQKPILSYLDYIKVGPYKKELGGLRYPSTNQILYKLDNGEIDEDITHLFWRTNIR